MKQTLKQRMVGAIILAALAVIFIPMLLKGPVDQGLTDVPIAIPPRPVVEVDEALAAAPEEPPVSDADFTRSVPLESDHVQPPPELPAESAPVALDEPSPVEQTPPELASWAVQVGSFGRESNAVGLRDKLRASGYSAYVDAIDGNGERFYRVRVGPVVSREEADRLKDDLVGKVQLKGLVVSHP